MGKQIPNVPIWRGPDGTGQVLCEYCSRLHHHGRLIDGTRGSECTDLTEPGTYNIFTVPGPVPDAAKAIDKKSRHLQMILRDRKERRGWWAKYKRPTMDILAEWEELKSQAVALNRKVLKEEHFMIFNNIEIRPEMTMAEAEAVTQAMKPGDIKALGEDAAIILLVKNKDGEVWRTEDGKLDFSVPDTRTPEEIAEQKLRSQAALTEYWQAHRMV